MFHFTVTSPYTLDQTVDRAAEAFQEESFGVLWNFDVKGKLDEKGVGLDEGFRVLEVCSPKVAKDALSATKEAGYFLPCKVVAYEEENEVKIGMPRPTVLMKQTGNKEAEKLAEDVEERMSRALEAAVKSE
ncbi:DUF302 domain-containing protein [Alkalicoccus urumqiensis]|uniref:DUF302 domain-containing protein n=1 Tax=Alkalicoccus urumqiensis TaxID=1548213 RepID=A0A2P6MET5_ALKUR|nr:DUF302 domain-containing protein [Alkalicoccus urumqiensis]PRO64825.1 hypothetical protein C6I21_13015 [Alkalicoccus urumqiensis]